MTIEELQNICIKLPGVIQDIKWESHLCFNVGDKMFLITSPDDVPISASFKMLPDEFEELVNKPGFAPPRYLAKHHWIAVENINKLSKKEWEKYILQSYRLIASKLSLKLRNKLKII
jgi:predicted DNA-binding protein (MmcQ/YjbR family)